MFSSKIRSRSGRHIYRLNKIRKFTVIFILIFAVGITTLIVSGFQNRVKNNKRELLRIWNAGNYEQAYEISKNALNEKPVDYFLLTTNGFSAYQWGISQINNHNTLTYINDCIRSLRKAILLRISSKDARVFYVLGKAYSYKGPEYSDLAVKYLEMADNLNYSAQDIPEYLGLAYAAAGDYRNSVSAFTKAFNKGSVSDNLLMSIARSYMGMGEYDMAVSYLKRCTELSPDSKSVFAARLLLAEVYIHSGDHSGAQAQYLSILDEYGENAEVRYQLGELFNLIGDTTRARAEWRIAYRQDPAHTKARARLNI
ncbi:MAG: tetratricopeptide repeat protein [Treponema sp.]|jgi:tetratricopeptide (TPR) repeat protein|nr:tetratricopeptide repeat protein [Treponema sp.]